MSKLARMRRRALQSRRLVDALTEGQSIDPAAYPDLDPDWLAEGWEIDDLKMAEMLNAMAYLQAVCIMAQWIECDRRLIERAVREHEAS
jgi:hypothetical protein